jgi:hypothetical protein
MSKKEAHPVSKTTYQLTKEELLELRNCSLRRNLLELQVQKESDDLTKDQQVVEKSIEARLGISLVGTNIDLRSGSIKMPESTKVTPIEPPRLQESGL